MSSVAAGKVCLGFFGDPMQQIYQQGIGSVELEAAWESVEEALRTFGPRGACWDASTLFGLTATRFSN